ncbi:MAG: hypothetical protein QUS14_17735 [Pyrinomonadaceae bacterium]|nr:hypothetical protein [Pyrinomonadaceae bacterium]
MKVFYTALIVTSALFSACTFGSKPAANEASPSPAAKSTALADAPKNTAPPAEAGGGSTPSALGTAAARELCYETDTGDNVVLKSQTFAIEFEPYKGSCFVTAHNPEFDDPPMESEFAIYKGNKKVADFPNQFNGATFGCWVEGVAFQDLNDDKLIDVIVAGKCSAKSAAYNENTVYVNTGKGFTTNEDGNIRVSEFKTIKEIADFVRENKQIYFK